MGKAIVGFVAGFALGALTLVLIFETRDQPLSQAAESSSLPTNTVPTTVVESDRAVRRNDIARPDLAEEESTPDVSGADPQPTLAELEQEAEEANRAWLAAQQRFFRARDADRWANEPPPTHAITLPPEFDYLFEERNSSHERLQREPVDPAWSAVTEAQLNSHFSARPEITEKYGYPIINCRTTGCEVAFIAYGIENSGFADNPGLEVSAMFEFQADNADIFEQPWTEQFASRRVEAGVHTEDGVTTILWYLRKSVQ